MVAPEKKCPWCGSKNYSMDEEKDQEPTDISIEQIFQCGDCNHYFKVRYTVDKVEKVEYGEDIKEE